jgi:hypothetical protein
MHSRIVFVLVLSALAGCTAPRQDAIDFVDRYPLSEKRSAFDPTLAFSVRDVTIEGTRRRSILAHAPARLSWPIHVPADGKFETFGSLRPEAWDRRGDGVVFRVGVSIGTRYIVLASTHVDPFHRPGDRRWVPLEADLSAYANQTVTFVLSTDASPAGQGLDSYNDLSVWGDPRIIHK